MSSINEEEISRLRKWASENKDKDVFDRDGEHEKSYWKIKDRQETYIMEYDFKTIPEFETLCDFVLDKRIDSKIQRSFSVAAFKHSKDCEQEQDEQRKADLKLPEHIYVF